MILSARLLSNCYNVNAFDQNLQLAFTEGDTVQVYLQLVDLTKDASNKPLSGKRYIPASGSTLSIQIKSVDVSKTLTKVCTNPFPGDLSIWTFGVTSTDALKGTLGLLMTLTEPGSPLVVTHGRVDSALLVQPISSFCMGQ
jgi:hypothetical protein